MSKRDGGPAFPCPEWFESAIEGEVGQFVHDHPGMTIRDWYKGQALVGILASGPLNLTPKQHADEAGLYADAMLAEGEKKS